MYNSYDIDGSKKEESSTFSELIDVHFPWQIHGYVCVCMCVSHESSISQIERPNKQRLSTYVAKESAHSTFFIVLFIHNQNDKMFIEHAQNARMQARKLIAPFQAFNIFLKRCFAKDTQRDKIKRTWGTVIQKKMKKLSVCVRIGKIHGAVNCE